MHSREDGNPAESPEHVPVHPQRPHGDSEVDALGGEAAGAEADEDGLEVLVGRMARSAEGARLR